MNDKLSENSVVIDEKIRSKEDEIFKLKDNFKNSVNEKDEEISRLKSLLSQRNYKIDELTENVGSLNHDLEVLSL